MSVEINPVDIAHSPQEFFLWVPENIQGLVFFSSDGSEGAQYSVLAMNPSENIRYDGNQVWRNDVVTEQDLHEVLGALIKLRKTDQKSDLPFLGGLIGSLDFEYGYELMDLPKAAKSDQQVYWNVYDHLLVFDHQLSQWFEIIREGKKTFSWDQWTDPSQDEEDSLELKAQWSSDQYHQVFEKLHQQIQFGEIYQACLSFPFHGESLKNPRQVFSQFLQKNPAPMAAYLEQASRQILSFSPERFLHWDGHSLETKPIKGTRPRAASPEEDLACQQELLSDEKEQAELNMITDLLRNDLARVCRPGTVKVLEHRALLECPTVWHSYSHIVGKTKEGITAWDIIRQTFPGGSISGCPKRRALEILRELETSPRGIYTGCIGYISDHGHMDLNIAIRTLENTPTGLQAGFGGGIVFDSEAEKEYQECYDKARIFL